MAEKTMIDFAQALVALRYFPTLIAFAPLMTKCYFSKNLLNSLAAALFYGTIVDLFATNTHFGISAVNYMLTTLLIHRLKWHINPHKLYSIPIYTFLFSLTSTLLSLMISAPVCATCRDLFIFPILDMAYAFIWFSCPPLVYDYLKSSWVKYRHG